MERTMYRTLEKCRDGIRSALDGLSAAEIEAAANGKWSVASIVEHLDLTYTANIRGLERRLQKGGPAPRQVTVTQRVRKFIVTRLGYFPTGIPAPAAVSPQGRRFAEVSAVIEPHLLVLDQRLKDVARAFGANTPVLNHPILGPFSVADWRRFHWVHTRHHLRQIGDKKRVTSKLQVTTNK
jgi:hypothetical protein